MATLVVVFGTVLLADGTPASGDVWWYPQVSAVVGDDPPVVSTEGGVRAPLDPDGSWTVSVVASDDETWLTDGPVPYRVVFQTTGLNREYTTLVYQPGPWNVTQLVWLDSPPGVVVLPTPGAPPVMVTGVTTTLPPGSPATSEVVGTGEPDTYAINIGVPTGLTGGSLWGGLAKESG